MVQRQFKENTWNLPGSTLRKKSKPEKAKGDKSQASSKIKLLPASTYLAVIDKIFPYKGDIKIVLPVKEEEPVKISKFKSEFFAPAAADQINLKIQDASV